MVINLWDNAGILEAEFSGTLSGTYNSTTTASTSSGSIVQNSSATALFFQSGVVTGAASRGSFFSTTSQVANFYNGSSTLNWTSLLPSVALAGASSTRIILTQASNGSTDATMLIRGTPTSGIGDNFTITYSGGRFSTGVSSSDFVLDDTTRTWNLGTDRVITLNLNAIPEPSTVIGMALLSVFLGGYAAHIRRKRSTAAESK